MVDITFSPIQAVTIEIDQEYLKKYMSGFLIFLCRNSNHTFWMDEVREDELKLIDEYMKQNPFGE